MPRCFASSVSQTGFDLNGCLFPFVAFFILIGTLLTLMFFPITLYLTAPMALLNQSHRLFAQVIQQHHSVHLIASTFSVGVVARRAQLGCNRMLISEDRRIFYSKQHSMFLSLTSSRYKPSCPDRLGVDRVVAQ